MKETLGHVKLEWTCPRCGSKNPGPEPKCLGCGAPQAEDVDFEQAAQEELLTDEQEIARAKSGPDVHCAYCGARHRADAKKCPQCGADLREGRKRKSGQVVGAHRPQKAGETPCPACGALNPANTLKCPQCGASMAQAKKSFRAAAAAPASNKGCAIGCGIAIAAFVALIVIFVILTSRTHDIVGRVQSASWTRSIAIEALGPVSYAGWRDEIPLGATLGACRDKVHHSQPDPLPNAEKVCGTPYTVDLGNGYGEVVQDCEYNVYADWCQYTVAEWREVDRVELNGADFNPRWPQVKLRSGQREGQYHESYQILFMVNDKEYTYKTDDENQFLRCEIGSRWTLKVNTFDKVMSIKAAN